MTRQDMKEEFKESEGSPEVKARMRRLQMEASQRAAEQSQSVDNVKDATVIITNPTHFAVAIKYDPENDDAPLILAMGKDIIAKRVIEQAERHSKTIVRSPILARALFFTGNIGQTISEQLPAVASILAYVYQLERGVDASLQEPEVPSDFILTKMEEIFKVCMVKRNSSLGVLISTLVFFFAGLWLILEGKALLESTETLKGILVILGGCLSVLAAFRFKIQKFF